MPNKSFELRRCSNYRKSNYIESLLYIPEQTCSFNFCTFVPFGIAHQGCVCALFRGICTAPTTSKMELFVTLLNDFQSLTNVTKNYILDVMGVLDPSLLLRIKILFQNIDT